MKYHTFALDSRGIEILIEGEGPNLGNPTQIFVDKRPDGKQPHGCDFALDFYRNRLSNHGQQLGLFNPFGLDKPATEELIEEALELYDRYTKLHILHEDDRVKRDTEQFLEIYDLLVENSSEPALIEQLKNIWPDAVYTNAFAISSLSEQKGRHKEAIEVIDDALGKVNSALGGSHLDGEVLKSRVALQNNAARILNAVGLYEKALHHVQQSYASLSGQPMKKDHQENFTNMYWLVNTLVMYGRILINQKDYDNAMAHYKEAMGLTQRNYENMAHLGEFTESLQAGLVREMIALSEKRKIQDDIDALLKPYQASITQAERIEAMLKEALIHNNFEEVLKIKCRLQRQLIEILRTASKPL